MKYLAAKLTANTALGHFVFGLLAVLGSAAVSYLLNDPSLTTALVSVGIPLSVVKFGLDLVRSAVPNS